MFISIEKSIPPPPKKMGNIYISTLKKNSFYLIQQASLGLFYILKNLGHVDLDEALLTKLVLSKKLLAFGTSALPEAGRLG